MEKEMSDFDVEALSSGDMRVSVHTVGDASPRVFSGHWNKGLRELMTSYKNYVRTGVQPDHEETFVVYTSSMNEATILTVDFSKVAFIQANREQ